MREYSKHALRVGFMVLILVSVGLLAQSYVSADEVSKAEEIRGQAELPADERTPVAEPRDGTTVITTQQREHAARAPGEMIAIGPDGTVRYYDRSYHSYWDSEAVAGTDATVMYVAAEHVETDRCSRLEAGCWRNVVETVNLTTGEVERLHERMVPIQGSGRWHDVDRIDEDRIVIADINRDRVVVVNHTTDLVTWSWDAQAEYDIESGEGAVDKGRGWPDDWTHVNDVEVLDDGRIMASLRNQDQVVFLDPEEGRVDGWTLGSDDDYETLYEQHNADYIPEDRGGPAVVVSDSENSRIVEYQREDGEWERSWTWADRRLQWPRDADRLPNGNTLVTDSHGGRVLEVDAMGEVVWQIDVVAPYEAERLETGPESAGGPSAQTAGLDPRAAEVGDGGGGPLQRVSGTIWGTLSGFVPSIVLNGVLYVLPVWMGLRDVFSVVLLVGTVATWSVVEFWLSPFTLTTRWPVEGIRTPVTLSRDDE